MKNSLLVELSPIDGGHPVHGRNITPSWFDICISGCCVDAIFARGGGRNAVHFAPSPGRPSPSPDIYTRFCSSHLYNKCGPDRTWSGWYTLSRWKVTPDSGKNVASRFASWPGRSPVINCAQGSPRCTSPRAATRHQPCAPLSLVYTRSCMRLYDSCHVQGFRSLLPAITVARRARIIALIVSTRELDTRVTRAVKDNFRGGPYLGIK